MNILTACSSIIFYKGARLRIIDCPAESLASTFKQPNWKSYYPHIHLESRPNDLNYNQLLLRIVMGGLIIMKDKACRKVPKFLG